MKRIFLIFCAGQLAAERVLAQIDQQYTPSGAGDWTATGNWTQGTGTDVPDYPVAGDWVTLVNGKTFSSDEAFGNATSNSFWSNPGALGADDIDMNANTWSVTNNGTLIFDGVDCRLQDGTFLNRAVRVQTATRSAPA
jgi:hypothetical protein